MRTHDQVVAKLMRRIGMRRELERIARVEGALLSVLLKCPPEGGPDAGAGGRTARSSAAGKHPPSLAMPRKYAQAVGKQLELRLS